MPKKKAFEVCTFEGCGGPHHCKGLCRLHYEQARRGTPLRLYSGPYLDEMCECAAPDCSNTFRQRSVGSKRKFCSTNCHARTNMRARRADGSYVPPHKRADRGPCSVEGCDRPRYCQGLCVMHYTRVVSEGAVGQAESKYHPGVWRVNGNGYVERWDPETKGTQLQHRWVMEQKIGRPLYPEETVHHRNGKRDDNCDDNLELWVKPQPAGQRVEDLVAWVVEHYPQYVKDALTTL